MISCPSSVNNISMRRNLYRRLSTPSTIDLTKMMKNLNCRAKVDEAVDKIEDILLADEFSPRAIDCQMERVSMYANMGECFEYGRECICYIMKSHQEYDYLRQKYDFIS